MSSSLLNYPTHSDNLGRRRSRFWTEFGFEVVSPREIEEAADHLYVAPVYELSPNGIGSDVSQALRDVEGEMSLAAARKLVGDFVDDGDKLAVRMLESGASPEAEKTYDGVFNVKNLSLQERRSIPNSYADPFFVEKAPEDFSYGRNYDFVLTGHKKPGYQ